ncbi:MAG: AbrB/MazE/SpoVT family DNA-binding domain-containing protein [Chloroflexota bacterium]|nr:AbrB/MazE/SpoVT family DNA-binding domain-containing protein [Chloroflexota bacterium]
MKEIISTMTSKGQVTIPAEVRKQLGIKAGDKITFVIEEGRIALRAPIYPTVASLRGAAGSLAKPREWDEMRAIAREDQANAAHTSTPDS